MSDYPVIQQFRIWSPEESKFYYSGGTPSMLSGFFEQTARLHTVHKMPYQRNTFLHDKNGKEIYEGDVLEVQDSGAPVYHSPMEWVGAGFWLTDARGGHYRPNSEFLEVIGNIYEHSELLENK